MSAPKRLRINISPEAQDDFADMVLRGSATWGSARAEAYSEVMRHALDDIARFPGLGRSAEEYVPGARRLVVEQHVIYYRVEIETIFVVRVLHRKQDAAEILRHQRAADPERD